MMSHFICIAQRASLATLNRLIIVWAINLISASITVRLIAWWRKSFPLLAEGRHAQVILDHRGGAGPAVADRAIVAPSHGAAHKLVLFWRWFIGASFELDVYAMVAAPGGRDKYVRYAGMYPLPYQPRSGALIA